MKALAALLLVTLGTLGCLSLDTRPIDTADNVDIPRFMGRWYVISNIPTPFEKNVYEAVEEYTLDDDGRVQTRFTYRDGSFEAPIEEMTPVGHVYPDSGNARWGMQFIWPFRADYRILYVSPDYAHTVIGRARRDYAWIMSRQARIDEGQHAELVNVLVEAGYDVSGLRRVPQRTPKGES